MEVMRDEKNQKLEKQRLKLMDQRKRTNKVKWVESAMRFSFFRNLFLSISRPLDFSCSFSSLIENCQLILEARRDTNFTFLCTKCFQEFSSIFGPCFLYFPRKDTTFPIRKITFIFKIFLEIKLSRNFQKHPPFSFSFSFKIDKFPLNFVNSQDLSV